MEKTVFIGMLGLLLVLVVAAIWFLPYAHDLQNDEGCLTNPNISCFDKNNR